MLGINCLVDNPSILPQLKETVEYVGYKILEGGNKADINKVYNTIRKLGVEVDMQTVSHIYQEVFDTNDKELFSSAAELESAREDTFRRLAEKKVTAAKQEIGRDNPAVTVASAMASTLQDLGKRNPSAQKELEQGLRKAASKIMAENKEQFPPAKREMETIEELLNRVFRSEEPQSMTVNDIEGKMNTAKELFEQFQKEIKAVANMVTDKDALTYAYGPYGIKLQQFADIVQQSGYDLFMSQPEIRRVINDALNESGFTKEIKDKDGNPKTITDWNKVIASNVDFKEALKEALSAKGFSEDQIASITPTLVREFQTLRGEKIKTKLNPKESEAQAVEPKNGLDKLVELNNMGIFEGESKKQLYKLLGVTELDEKSVSVIESISNLLKELGETKNLSTTFIRSMNRQIELELGKIQDKGLMMGVANAFSSYMQFANGLLISNIGNTFENASSGVLQLGFTLATNPKTGMKYLRSGLTVFKDILQGGVREGVNYSDAFSANLNIGDKYNPETADNVKGRVWALANTLSRSVLETFDSSTKAAMTNIMFASTIKKMLTKQGMTTDEADTIINETLYGNNPEVDALAETLTKTLEAAGLNITLHNVKKERIANELRRANILSNGTFFQSVIEDLIATRAVSEKAREINIDKKVFDGILNAAEATAGKGLGHSSDNWIFQKMFDEPSRKLSQQLSNARKKGNKGAVAGMTFANTGHYALNKFVGGAARWSWLTFQKTSRIALAQTLLTDILLSEGVVTPGEKKVFHKEMIGKYLNFSKLSENFDIEYKDGKPVREDGKSRAEYEIEKYLSLRERLKREIVAPIIGYGVALPLIKVIAKMLGFGFDDDDTEEEKARKVESMAYWLNRPEQADVLNVLKKVAPVEFSTYLGTLAKKNKYGQPVLINPNDDKNDLLKTYFNTDVLNSIFIESFNRGAGFNIQEAYIEENQKKDPNMAKLTTKTAVELLNIGTPFKWWDMNKGFENGINLGRREKLPVPRTIQDQAVKSIFTRDMFRKYMQDKPIGE